MRVEGFVKQRLALVQIVLISLFTFFFYSHTFFLKLYKMNTLPSDVVDDIYRYSHQMIFSKCMKQLKLYRVHGSLNVSWDFIESAHYV